MLFAINNFKMWFIKKQPTIPNKNPDKSFFKQTSSKQVDHLYSVKMVGVFIELEVLLEALYWRNTSLKVDTLPCLFNLAWLHAIKNESVIISYNSFTFIFVHLSCKQKAVHGSATISRGEHV